MSFSRVRRVDFVALGVSSLLTVRFRLPWRGLSWAERKDVQTSCGEHLSPLYFGVSLPKGEKATAGQLL